MGRSWCSSPLRLGWPLMIPLSIVASHAEAVAQAAPTVERLAGNPIITPEMLPGSEGENINGPSLIQVPNWLRNPLGKYYLYFSHHQGGHIRLAYADALSGPWTVYEPGTLRLEQTACDSVPTEMVPYKHVASPDVHVDHQVRKIRMYFHCNIFLGGDPGDRSRYPQVSLVATSSDGLAFEAHPAPLGHSYFRAFRWDGRHYALGMPGVFWRSPDGLADFEEGPRLFSPDMRHSAVMVKDGQLMVFYTDAGATPERILLSTIDLSGDWMAWTASAPVVVLEPETEWEGGSLPFEASRRGAALEPVRQLRDPALFEDDSGTYLLYSVAGEQGIAIARISWGRD